MPAAAGIPVTHRGVSDRVTIATAHAADGSEPDYGSLARAGGTLVLFMGLERLERFVSERPGGAVIVSHDRAFLERTVTRVLELDEIAHTAAEYGGGWAGYLQLRATAERHA